MMRTKVISVLLAASLAATVPLTPAQANPNTRNAERTAAALVFGLATLAIIAKAAEAQKDDKKKKEKKSESKPRPYAEKPPQVITREGRLPYVYPRDHKRHEPRHRSVTVPASCARRVETQGGIRTTFGAPCLRREGVDIARLPDRCERLADTGRRDVRIWGARCLTRNGVRIE